MLIAHYGEARGTDLNLSLDNAAAAAAAAAISFATVRLNPPAESTSGKC
jgi:hypothetical protein